MVDKTSDVLSWRSEVVEGGGSQISSASPVPSASPRQERPRGPGPSQLDPDRDEVFYEPEPVRIAMKRKKRGRESSILSLTLRRVGSTVSSKSGSQVQVQAPTTERPSESGGESASVKDGATSFEGESSTDDDDDDMAADISALHPGMLDSPPSASPSRLKARSSRYDSNTISSTATNSTFRAQVTQVSGRPASLASIFSKEGQESDVRSDDATSQAPSQADERNVSLAASSLNALWNIGSGFQSLKGKRGDGPRSSDAASFHQEQTAIPEESPHIKHSEISTSIARAFAQDFARIELTS